MQARRSAWGCLWQALSLTVLVGFSPGWAQEPPGARLQGWTYAVTAPPLADTYADPGGRLADGVHGRERTAIWRGGTVTVDIALPRTAHLTAVRVYQHRHNLNYKLGHIAVLCRVGGQWEEHGRMAAGFVGPTPGMDFVHTLLTGGVRTDAVRLEFAGVGVLSLSEVELFGDVAEAPATVGGAFANVPFAESAAPTATERDLDGDGQPELVLENAHVRLIIAPGRGGICRSLRLKHPGTELVGTADPAFGLLRDQLWKPDYSFADRTYFHRLTSTPDRAAAELWTTGTGGMMSFTEVRKTLALRRDSPVVAVHYALTNQPSSQTTYEYGLWFHNWLGDPQAGTNAYLFPTRSGLCEFRLDEAQRARGADRWYRDPARGWTAVVNEHGTGLAIELPYRTLNLFYGWHGSGAVAATLEWRFNLLTLQAGEKIEADLRLVPFRDLLRVQGVAADVVGGFAATAAGVEALLNVPAGAPALAADVEVSRAGTRDVVSRATAALRAGQTNRIVVPLAAPRPDLVARATLRQGDAVVGVIEGTVATPPDAPPLALAPEGPQEGRREDSGPSREEHRLSTRVATACIPWAKPLPGGPIRALVLMDDMNSREAVELAQRVDLELDYVKFRTTLEKEYLWQGDLSIQTLEGAQKRLLERLRGQPYDVLVVAGFRWDFHLTQELRDLVVERVRAGMGLVLIQPDGFTQAETARLPAAGIAAAGRAARDMNRWHAWAAVESHPLTNGLDWARFPLTRRQDFEVTPAGTVLATIGQDRAPLLVVSAVDKGRVVTATWDTLTHDMSYRGYSALTPILSYRGGWLRPEFASLPRGYHEWWFALLARLVTYAAGRDLGVEVTAADRIQGDLAAVPPVAVRLHRGNGVLELAQVEAFWQNALGDQQRTEVAVPTSTAADSAVVLSPPAGLLTVGDNTVCFVLRDRLGAARAWGFTTLTLGAANRLTELRLAPAELLPTGGMWQVDGPVETRAFTPAVPLRAEAGVTPAAGADLSAWFAFTDTRGRLLHEARLPLVAGADRAVTELPPVVLVDQGIEVAVSLYAGERLLDRRRARAVAFAPRIWERFWFTSWGGQYLWRSRYLFDDVSRRVRDYGVDVSFVGETEMGTGKARENAYWGINPAWLGLLSYLGKGVPDFGDAQYSAKAAAYAKTKDKANLIRTPSLVDPVWRGQVAAKLDERVARIMPWGGAVDYCMGDEMSLTHYTAFHDYDWSPASLADFRRWLQVRYPDLPRLNQAWGTAFPDWGAVVPLTRDEAREAANPAPWCEFRLYMNDQLAAFYRFVQTTIRRQDPQARCGLSGTQSPEAGNGMDWWKLSEAFSYYHSYNTSWSNELRRSFRSAGRPADQSPYFSGYSAEDPACERNLWWCLFHDTRGISCWKTDLFFFGDFTRTPSGEDTHRHLTELRNGIWRLVRGSRRQHDGIALYYSMPTVIVGALTGEEARINAYRDAWVKLVEDSGLQYEFVSSEQLGEGLLDQGGFRLLILPHAIAMSALEAEAVKRFVQGGGAVFATLRPGRRDELGRPQSPALLDELFGVRQEGNPRAVQPGITLRQPLGGPPAASQLLLAPGLTDLALAGGEAQASADEGRVPVLIRGAAGRAVLWNLDLTDLEQERRFHSPTEKGLRALLAAEMARLGVAPPFPISLANGQPPHVETVVYRLDEARLLGLLNWDGVAQQATIRLEQAMEVCDLRAGRSLGRLERLEVPLEPGSARLFALTATPPCRPTVAQRLPPAALGQPLALNVGLDRPAGAARSQRQLIRLDVTDGAGRQRPEYTQTVWVVDAPVPTTIPTARNDPPGTWRIRATDLSSGLTAALTVSLR